MKSAPKEKDCDRILIVEGYSDLLFYAEFLEHLGVLEGVFIKSFGGESAIRKDLALSDYLSSKFLTDKKSIGIIMDGDFNPAGAVESLQTSLRKITGRDVEEGVWSPGSPNLGFFVVPDPETNGEIETLVWNTWSADPSNASASREVLEYLAGMAQLGLVPKSPDKGKLGAFLSVRSDEDPRLGPSAREKLFNFEASGFERLKNFLLVLGQ